MPFHANCRSATLSGAVTLLSLASASWIAAAVAAVLTEPRITSVSPCAATAGSSVTLRIRGSKLDNAVKLWSPTTGLSGTVKAGGGPTSGENDRDWIEVELAVKADVPTGRHDLRIVTDHGLSNALPLEVTAKSVQNEAEVTALTAASTIAGTLAKPGEVDTYWLNLSAGEIWTFQARGGTPGVDLSLALAEPSGSWFDPRRLNRIAANDEPVHFPGLSSSPHLVYRFSRPGRYALSVSAFAGQGGPDATYVLSATRGALPEPAMHPELDAVWEERQFTRPITDDWLHRLSSRGSTDAGRDQIETWSAAEFDAAKLPAMSVPGIARGRIAHPAAKQAIELRIDKPEDLVLEIETPKATLPRFNPVVRLLDAGGNEVVTNVHTKRNNNGLYMMKMIHPKATVALRSPGSYRLEIRDITTDCGGEDFEYRVAVRRRIPHLGKVSVTETQVNLRPGGLSELHLNTEREEDFAGTVAFEMDGLPHGVSMVPAVANPIEKPPLPNAGKIDRYTPRTQASVLLLQASAETPGMDRPVLVRIFARLIVGKVWGNRILVRELPLLVSAGSS